MNTILDTIVAAKKKELEKRKPLNSIGSFERESGFWNLTNLSLRKHLLADGSTGIIAEFKRRSPSKGWLKPQELEVKEVVGHYNDFGAAALSILTDEEFFGGKLDDLAEAKSISRIPVLRKDFILDEWQIAEAKAYGADVILLIAACLSPLEVQQLASFARQLGLEVLLELHEEKELGHVCAETDIVGINNRDLRTFEVDIERSLRMAEQIPGYCLKIAESGINSVENIRLFRENGFKGFLVGEHFMKEANPGVAFSNFVKQLKSI